MSHTINCPSGAYWIGNSDGSGTMEYHTGSPLLSRRFTEGGESRLTVYLEIPGDDLKALADYCWGEKGDAPSPDFLARLTVLEERLKARSGWLKEHESRLSKLERREPGQWAHQPYPHIGDNDSWSGPTPPPDPLPGREIAEKLVRVFKISSGESLAMIAAHDTGECAAHFANAHPVNIQASRDMIANAINSAILSDRANRDAARVPSSADIAQAMFSDEWPEMRWEDAAPHIREGWLRRACVVRALLANPGAKA